MTEPRTGRAMGGPSSGTVTRGAGPGCRAAGIACGRAAEEVDEGAATSPPPTVRSRWSGRPKGCFSRRVGATWVRLRGVLGSHAAPRFRPSVTQVGRTRVDAHPAHPHPSPLDSRRVTFVVGTLPCARTTSQGTGVGAGRPGMPPLAVAFLPDPVCPRRRAFSIVNGRPSRGLWALERVSLWTVRDARPGERHTGRLDPSFRHAAPAGTDLTGTMPWCPSAVQRWMSASDRMEGSEACAHRRGRRCPVGGRPANPEAEAARPAHAQGQAGRRVPEK